MATFLLKSDEDLIDEALLVYLGATEASPGYRPGLRRDQKIREMYPTDWQPIHDDLNLILQETMKIDVDWDQYPWPKEAGGFVVERLATLFPWMSRASRESLASYFAYQWK